MGWLGVAALCPRKTNVARGSSPLDSPSSPAQSAGVDGQGPKQSQGWSQETGRVRGIGTQTQKEALDAA